MFHDDLCKGQATLCVKFSLSIILAVKNKIRPTLAHGVYLQELETMMNWETNGNFAFIYVVLRLFDVYSDKPLDTCTDMSDEIIFSLFILHSFLAYFSLS
jgi:hypothetical protein